MENKVVKTLVRTPDGKLVVEDVDCLSISDTKFETQNEKNDDSK